ncbi:MAG: alpha-L-arabinofuranosidase C-terminal domain-containing protein [Candidatus Hadarchaeum sp.]|uniref:alpha-N-arabinofuranosidase n=1 Tax=Candidatus Hadarchaeum sp. TaxID=2883567 RepID=UPI003172D183
MKCRVKVDTRVVIGTLDRRCYGQFIEHLGECIYGGIWVGENSKIPNERGFRLDVLRAVKELNPPLIRWPGGNFASGYHWIDGVGPRDKRPKSYDMAWGAEEPNYFGTDEFIEFCRLVGAEPFIVVNAGNGTPEEAAHWVEYCNSSRETYYASLRRRYGHEKPYGVKLWGVGNELWGEWQVGFCKDGAECARRTVEFANEMRKVDPNIELVAVGCEDPEWNIEMVKEAGKYFDYLSIHFYDFDNKPYRELVAIPIDVERRLKDVYNLVQSVRRKYGVEREIKIAFDEWNVWYPEAKAPLLTQVTSVKDAIFTAGILNMLQRLCNIVPISNFAQTVNVLPLIIASSDGRIVLTPQYLVFKMYCNNKGANVLRTFTDSDLYMSSSIGEYVPHVDISAMLSEDSKTLYIYALNRDEEDSVELQIVLKGFNPKSGMQQFISGESVDDKNTFEDPDRVKIEEARIQVTEGEVRVDLKPHSVNVIRLVD